MLHSVSCIASLSLIHLQTYTSLQFSEEVVAVSGTLPRVVPETLEAKSKFYEAQARVEISSAKIGA